MSADLSQVQPGWRGTDPDGGTWVLTNLGPQAPWLVTDANGHSYTTQEEAEAAGLVPMEARRDPNESGLPSWQEELIKAAADVVIGVLCPGGRVIETPDGTRLVLTRADAAPAPLDPGNPEHLRQVADALLDDANTMVADGDLCRAMHTVEFYLRGQADRLDREQREAEQEVAEEAFVQGIYERWCASDGTDHDLIREAIRAERARQEAGQ